MMRALLQADLEVGRTALEQVEDWVYQVLWVAQRMSNVEIAQTAVGPLGSSTGPQ